MASWEPSAFWRPFGVFFHIDESSHGKIPIEIENPTNQEQTFAVRAVKSVITTGEFPPSFVDEKPKQGSHGPAFFVVVSLLRDLFLPEGTALELLRFNHYLHFMMFQVGTV